MKKKIVIGIIVLVALVIGFWLSVYPDWLWFQSLGYPAVFLTVLVSKYGFGAGVWVLLIVILWVNLHIARRLSPAKSPVAESVEGGGVLGQIGLSGNSLNILLMVLVLIASVIVASKGAEKWDMLLRYIYQEPTAGSDPLFGRPVGFYLFSLPFYIFVRNGLLLLFLFAGALSILWYVKDGALQILEDFAREEGKPPSLPKISITEGAKKHLLVLAAIVIVLIAWGYHLKVYGLLYSTQGPAFGASFTDVHVRVLAYRILIFISLAAALVLLASLSKLRLKVIYTAGAVWLGCLLLLGSIIPLVVQQFVVKPNELARESAYIEHNIRATRTAYDLNKFKEVDFPVSDLLDVNALTEHKSTIENIRIWDERPLLQTYRQIQSIRLYYDFHDVDVDRYMINGRYRQVMLSAREMDINKLPPQAATWVNRHLTYTHGYGLALSPVNEMTEEGLPRLFVKDLPPAFEVDFTLERPEIYYGEKTSNYVLVNTKNEEFDYPRGDHNVYTKYGGTGGVAIDSFLKRIVFALEFLDPQILFTTYLTPESRIMYRRLIGRRVRTLAPFLGYDRDPYLVVSGGKLYWIQDAYTTSRMYPYSSRSADILGKGWNYIRNSCKVVIDAYTGEVRFYVTDEKDPVMGTYMKIFPDLFKAFASMPEGLKDHIRYPADLFEVQVQMYKKYHMEDVQVFYNQEDLWEIPNELYGENRQKMEPYYIIAEIPGEEDAEFLLMLPFTPSNKDNMIAWLAARSDLPNYGSLLAYNLPKEKLVYGPMQIEARVDQQTEISREFSLWGQRGSQVIRGNLLAVPLGQAFIYVEPVYLEARQGESSPDQPGDSDRFGRSRSNRTPSLSPPKKQRAVSLPELKRVIAGYSSRLVMDETLDKALNRVLLLDGVPEQPAPSTVRRSTPVFEGGGTALEHYNRAKEALRRGDWAEYGAALERLERVLKDMASMSPDEK